MLVTRRSLATGIIRTIDLPVTAIGIARWEAGEKVQDVFPHLSRDQREFLMTGIVGDEWDKMFPAEEAS
jgi:hypothetical protein